MVGTHTSPAGRLIEYVEGEPSEIISRGVEIESLGRQMGDSADVLESIKNRSADQQGKAIEELRERIGDSYETLREAADLYGPVGPVIRGYGEELDTLQPQIKTLVDNCRELAGTYMSLPGSMDPRGTGGWGEPDEGSPEAADQAAEDAAKQEAYDAWKLEANNFDAAYNSWETAFDNAAELITDRMSGEIEDGFWRTALDFAGNVLEVAALVAGVAALFLTGPFAAIALAIGAAYLAVTVVQVAMGDKSLLDVGLAALGVVPFGKAGVLFQKGAKGIGPFAKEFVKPLGDFGQFSKITGVNKLLGGGKAQWFNIASQQGNKVGLVEDTIGRTFFNKSMTDLGTDVTRIMESGHGRDIAAGLTNLFGGKFETGYRTWVWTQTDYSF